MTPLVHVTSTCFFGTGDYLLHSVAYWLTLGNWGAITTLTWYTRNAYIALFVVLWLSLFPVHYVLFGVFGGGVPHPDCNSDPVGFPVFPVFSASALAACLVLNEAAANGVQLGLVAYQAVAVAVVVTSAIVTGNYTARDTLFSMLLGFALSGAYVLLAVRVFEPLLFLLDEVPGLRWTRLAYRGNGCDRRLTG